LTYGSRLANKMGGDYERTAWEKSYIRYSCQKGPACQDALASHFAGLSYISYYSGLRKASKKDTWHN